MTETEQDIWPDMDKKSSVMEELMHPQEIIPSEPFKISLGEALPENTPLAPKAAIISALKAVQDPELMFDIYSMGLIYEIDQKENGDVDIKMTLTSPTCPMGPEMIQMAAHAVASVVGVGVVKVVLTFDPPWTTDRLSEEIKLMMNL